MGKNPKKPRKPSLVSKKNSSNNRDSPSIYEAIRFQPFVNLYFLRSVVPSPEPAYLLIALLRAGLL